MEPRICPVCGQETPQGARFCTECGAVLDGQAVNAVPAVPENKKAPETDGKETLSPGAEAAVPLPEPVAYDAPSVEVSPPETYVPKPKPPVPEAPVPKDPVPAPAPVANPVPSTSGRGRPAQPSVHTYPEPGEDQDRPGKKSKYAPMTAWGMAIQLLLMGVPVLGLILMIVWSCGGCRKLARRNLARAYVILLVLGVVLFIALALVLRYRFPQELTRAFEALYPGYTIVW